MQISNGKRDLPSNIAGLFGNQKASEAFTNISESHTIRFNSVKERNCEVNWEKHPIIHILSFVQRYEYRVL